MFELVTEGMLFFEEKISKHRHLDKITMIDKTDEYDMCGSLQHTLAGYYFIISTELSANSCPLRLPG